MKTMLFNVVLPSDEEKKQLKKKKFDFMLNSYYYNRLRMEAWTKKISTSEMLGLILIDYFNKRDKEDDEEERKEFENANENKSF